ncbi:MAG: DUF2017 family protein [Ilumatobacteraceae bacterium]
MADRSFIPPVRGVDGGWALHLDDEERKLFVRLAGELRDMLSAPGPNPLLDRLFPVAYPGDAEKEFEYRRLMRDELVTSRVAALGTVEKTLGPDGPDVMDEEQIFAFMQALNAVRLVLGTLLKIEDDDDDDELADTPEHHLYSFLSWVLEWTVRALSPEE